ncbi:SpaA isopeptide-forming pilin-related protein, partial [Dysosmobacter sp.]
VENLLPGVVEVIEKSVPEPYLLAEDSQMVTLFPNRDRDVYFQNYKRPTIEIIKENSITHDRIENVPFQVWYASNNTATGEYNDLGVFYTDEEGRIVLSDPDLSLRDGWFRVKELEPAPGFALADPDTQEAFIAAGEGHTFRFSNRPLSAISVWKYDSETGAAIEGAVFQVRYLSGNTSGTGGTVIGTYRTSVNGSFTVTGCKAGTYIIEELSSDGSHVIDTPPQTVYLSGEDQEVVQVYFGNSPKGSLLIKKVSSADNSPISDVQFFVTESDGTVVGDSNGYFTTDSAGTILIEGIDPGTTLVVKETRAKDGFLLDDTPQTAQIKAGQTVTLEFRNQPTGQLIIHKLSGDDRKTPLEGVQFKITYSDGSFVDADSGQLSSNGLYWSNSAGQIILSGLTGTVVVTEVESIPGYTIDPNTQSQTVVINPNDTQELYFYNNPIGGIEIIKVNASKTSERIPDTTFEIRRMDDALVDTITTDRNGRAYLSLEDGSYYALEVEANPDFVLDDTPHYFEVKNGEVTTLRIKNEANSGILIHKVDTSGEGIYGVKFLLYDEDRNPIGEFTSDDEGWVYITADDLPDGANTSGRFYLRELEAAEGYILDEEYKTVYVRPGRTAEIEWVNTAITGQIQIWKKSADDNPINGFPAGTPLEGAVFGIYNKANALVDTVESDSRGLAVSKPLPLGRYTVKEISSPQFYSVSDEEVTVYLEHEGQIVQVEYLNESVYTNVSISKSGYTQVVPGQEIRYTFKDIGNNSTVPLDSFYWRDTLPTDAVRLDKIITGTYSARLNYKVVFQTNLNDTQRVLADNLNTQKNYTLDASPAALGLASNEYVTQVTFLFGRVPGGFKQVETPYIYCDVLSNLSHEYRFANKCDVGGMWQNQWVQATDRWVTIIYRGGPVPTLPRTGY